MNICFFTKTEEKYEKKISYIADLFFSTYGLDYRTIHSPDQLAEGDFPRPDLMIVYGRIEDCQSLRDKLPSDCCLLFMTQLFHQIFDQSPPELKRLKQKGTDYSVPILFSNPTGEKEGSWTVEEKSGREYPGVMISKNGGMTEIGCYADLFASSFYLLSLQEEKGVKRFKAKGSWREREALHQIPLVNVYFQILFDLIRQVAKEEGEPLLYKSFWPSGSKLAVALTHDVDILGKWFLYMIFRKWTLLKKGNFKNLIRMISKWPGFLFEKDKSQYCVSQLLDQERSRGYNSTFFFMSGEPNLKTTLKSDITYSIEKVEPVIKNILSIGGEIGLHGSLNSYSSREVLKAEKEKLDRFLPYSSVGIRQHFLYLENPSTWKYQSQIGFLYDCTLGYPDRSGFRSGLAFPFRPYDPETDQEIGIWEISTNVMDQTYDKYDPKTIDQMKNEIDNLFLQLENSGGGLLTLLWHTNVLEVFGFPGFVKLYGEILESLNKRNAFVSTGENIVKYWKARSEIQLVEKKEEKNNWQWKYQAVSPIIDLTYLIYQPSRDMFHIKVDGADALIRTDNLEILIIFPSLVQNQCFQIILTSEGA